MPIFLESTLTVFIYLVHKFLQIPTTEDAVLSSKAMKWVIPNPNQCDC